MLNAVATTTAHERPALRLVSPAEARPAVTVPDSVVALAERVAKFVYRRYATWVEMEDVFQTACEWACLYPDRVQEYLAMEPDRANAMLFASMRNHTSRYASSERDAAEGGPPRKTPSYALLQSRIECELLPAVFDRPAWDLAPAGSEYDTDHAWTAALAECAEAYRRLDAVSRDVVERCYRDGESVAVIAAGTGMTEARVESLLARAVRQIQQDLESEAEPPVPVGRRTVGSRQAMTNSAAIALTYFQSDGE